MLSTWSVAEAGGIVIDDTKMMDTPPSDLDNERDQGGYTTIDGDIDDYDYTYSADEKKEITNAVKRARRDIEYILQRHPFGHHKGDVLMKLITYLEKDIHNIEYLDIFDNNVKKRKRV
jgi:uncharacterized protein YecE (DUF72 family)